MCKIMAIPAIPEKTQNQAKLFLRVAKQFLTQIDNDGFGYAMLGEKGLHVERWLKPRDAFNGPRGSKKYSTHGKPSTECFSILAHSRLATCGKSIVNTHPFVSGDTVLIHNGIINNADELINRTSTCDSEVILNEYIKAEVGRDPKNIQKVADKLRGWYACAVMTKTENGWVLDVFKDETTPLYYAFIPDLDCAVICTSLDIIHRTARIFKYKVEDILAIPDSTLIRFDAVTGVIMEWLKFKMRPIWTRHDEKDYSEWWRETFHEESPIKEPIPKHKEATVINLPSSETTMAKRIPNGHDKTNVTRWYPGGER